MKIYIKNSKKVFIFRISIIILKFFFIPAIFLYFLRLLEGFLIIFLKIKKINWKNFSFSEKYSSDSNIYIEKILKKLDIINGIILTIIVFYFINSFFIEIYKHKQKKIKNKKREIIRNRRKKILFLNTLLKNNKNR